MHCLFGQFELGLDFDQFKRKGCANVKTERA